MRMSCPACGAEMTLDVLCAMDEAREVLGRAMTLPQPLGRLLLKYLTLHRPAKRQLTWDRVSSILAELLPDIERALITRNGRDWPAPQATWQAAIEHMLQMRDSNKLTLPLKGHGYLLEVIKGIAERDESIAEVKTEERRRIKASHGTDQVTKAQEAAANRVMPAEVSEFFAAFKAKRTSSGSTPQPTKDAK